MSSPPKSFGGRSGRSAKRRSGGRPTGPLRPALSDDLRKGLRLIRSQPRIGAVATNVRLPDVRRVHLSRIHYYLYYRVLADPPRIEVLALWHTSRGSGPRLP